MGVVVDLDTYRVLRDAGPLFPALVELEGETVLVDTPEALLGLLASICGAAPESTGLNLNGETDGT